MPNQPEKSAPFDAVADQYDEVFTRTPLGRRQRDIVRRYAGGIVKPPFRVLELNSGTGEDAAWLAGLGGEVVATDASAAMVAVARSKADASPFAERIRTEQMRIEDIATTSWQQRLGRFNMVFSNFDGLNCVQDLSWMPDALNRLLLPGGHAVFVFMNPVCAMEIAGELVRGRIGSAFQRMRRSGVDVHIGNGITMRTWFHSVARFRETFQPGYVFRRTEAVGLITPPTSLRRFYHRHQRAFGMFFGLEDLLSPLPVFNRMGDHVLIHIQKKD